MKFGIFILTVFLSKNATALQWQTQMHHIEPLFQEVETSVQEVDEVKCSDVTPAKYISDLPRTEPWRNFYKMPKLITHDLYKIKDVCEEAKTMNKSQGVEKKYAIVGHKTHFCDFGHRACISMLKSLSDPCNHFIQDNFQVFHTRTFIGQHKPKGSAEIQNEYGQMGPSLIVIDLATCSVVPTELGSKEVAKGMTVEKAVAENYFYTPPSLATAKDEKGEAKFRSEDESVRFHAMKESLLTNIPKLNSLKDTRVDCFSEGKRTLPGINDLEEVPYGEIKVKGILGIRKLMDEQYIDSTGINPYIKNNK